VLIGVMDAENPEASTAEVVEFAVLVFVEKGVLDTVCNTDPLGKLLDFRRINPMSIYSQKSRALPLSKLPAEAIN